MNIDLPYGKTDLKVDVPDDNLLDVVEKEIEKGLEEEDRAISRSLRDPIDSPPLSEMIGRDDEVAVIVTDNTRPCPEERLLPPLVEELNEGGVSDKNISIAIAYGLHSPLDRDGLVDLLGKGIVDRFDIINHVSEETVRIGETSRNIPVEVNKKVLDADFIMATGLIEPHFFAGYSGGRKSVMPGISSRGSTYGNHGYKMIGDPNSRPGILEENPIYQDSLEHAKIAGLDFILNVLMNREGQITEVVSGDPIEAHLEGVELEKRIVSQEIEREADVVITTNSGSPLDLNLYQTVKGMDHASLITKKGGTILVASECVEGVGSNSFLELHEKADSPEELMEIIREEEPIGVQWQNQVLARIQKNQEIILKSSLDDDLVRRMSIEPVKSIEAGLEICYERFGRDAEIVVMPEGPMLIPKIA